MRDATDLEANSINDYVNCISVDTDVNFYNRGDGRVSTSVHPKLKLCPFCGGEAIYKEIIEPYVNGGHPTVSRVMCTVCGASIMQKDAYLSLASVVITAWNCRV